MCFADLDWQSKMIILEFLFVTFEASSVFEAAGIVAKIACKPSLSWKLSNTIYTLHASIQKTTIFMHSWYRKELILKPLTDILFWCEFYII